MSLPKSGRQVLNPVSDGAWVQTGSSRTPSIVGGVSVRKGIRGGSFSPSAAKTAKRGANKISKPQMVKRCFRLITIPVSSCQFRKIIFSAAYRVNNATKARLDYFDFHVHFELPSPLS